MQRLFASEPKESSTWFSLAILDKNQVFFFKKLVGLVLNEIPSSFNVSGANFIFAIHQNIFLLTPP